MNINIDKWIEIYENNTRLDEIFISRYASDNYYNEKNVIALQVEFGEFINETKVFKYWTIKKPDKDKVLEEYSDVITMLLLFFNLYKVEVKVIDTVFEGDIFSKINNISLDMTKLMKENSSELLQGLFTNLLKLIFELGYEEIDILNAINKKHKIVEDRLNSDY